MKKWLLIAAVMVSGCNGGVVDRLLKKSSPYENYLESLESTRLRNYALVRDWKSAGEAVLNDSLQITLPYQEVAYFDPKKPKAMLLRYSVEEGHQVDVGLNLVSQKDATFFMDVFEWDPKDQTMERIHFADSSERISYRVKKSGVHALRIQPELFRGGVFSLNISYQGLLAFPIIGKNTVNIASFWGDPREGDVRKHEGVDIFSSRGTPVVAASSGRVRRVGNNRLGGKVVWLYNRNMGHSQYYAHLDSQLVQPGQQVEIGDTLGLVGNTGNALTTAPHLHFGIYKSGSGAVDPFPFLQDPTLPDKSDISDSVHVGTLGIIKASLANIRSSPSTASEKIGSFSRNTLLQIEGKSGSWYRILLPDLKVGYIFENLVEWVESPIKEIEISPMDEVRIFWGDHHPISGDIISGKAQVLGIFEDSYYIETSSGIKGWWGIN